MKENVITGHLIPAGTGFPEFRNVIVGSKEEYERQLEADNLETEFNAEAQPEEPAEL
jgi:DNA-directed RNA polymerase subunit beta'